MKKGRSGKIGFVLFLLFIIALLIGGQYLYNYVTNEDANDYKTKGENEDYRIDKTKDYFYFINESVISESAEIYYKDVVVNIKGSEHITETLNKENAIYKSNIKYISDQDVLSDELINYNSDNIYMVNYREYKTYKYNNYVSLVVLDYLYDCFDQSTIKDSKSYVFDTNTGKLLTNEELYSLFNTNEENIKKEIKEEVISKDSNSSEEILNKIKINTVVPKDVENTLKELKIEQREEDVEQSSEEFDIFGGLVQDSTKIRKIGNQSHREQPKDKFHILEINKMTKQIGFKLTLEQITKNIKNAFEKVQTPEDITIYKAIVDDKIDENQFNVFNVNPEKEMRDACMKDGKMINLYKINLKKGENIIGFTNCIFYDNQNKTLPVGMDLSTRVMVDISKIDLNIKKARIFSIASLENEEDVFSDVVVKKVTVYE